jgi:mRNA interferase YafQ
MRTIERTTQFKRDYKRISKGPHRDVLGENFLAIITALSEDQPLDRRHHDHALAGEWNDHRDCHIRPDLVLIYRKPDAQRLQLVRLGSHAELSL